MADTTTSAAKAPWHLWVVGVISLLWNAMGALDFTMTQLHNTTWLKAMTPEQLEYIYASPFWVVAAWGIATWGSLAGSGLLLTRKAAALPAFVASFIGMILTFVYNYLLTDWLGIMGQGATPAIFSAVIMMICTLLLVYALTMRKRGVLR